MSFNKFKATVRCLADLPLADLRDLFSWVSNSTIQADNKNLLIAKAANEHGETIAFVTAEPILLVDTCVLNPQGNREDDQKAGDAIDAALAHTAGLNRMWVVIPDEAPIMKGERVIRVFERKAYHPVTTQQLGVSNFKSSAGFLN
jgi:cyanophycinase-like exopeptidase